MTVRGIAYLLAALLLTATAAAAQGTCPGPATLTVFVENLTDAPAVDLTCRVGECSQPGRRKKLEKLARKIDRKGERGKRVGRRLMRRLGKRLTKCGVSV